MFLKGQRKRWYWSMPVSNNTLIRFTSDLIYIMLVINQMDTSQAHLSSNPKGEKVKDSTKPDNLSKDELTAVLKYGAQKM